MIIPEMKNKEKTNKKKSGGMGAVKNASIFKSN